MSINVHDPIKFEFIGVKKGNDDLQFKIFFKVQGHRVQCQELSKNCQKRLYGGF